MAFDIFNKSLFNEDSYKAAIKGKNNTNGYSVISIIPNSNRLGGGLDPIVVGVMQNALKFGVIANWEDQGKLSDMTADIEALSMVFRTAESTVGLVSKVGNVGGASDIGAVYQSKKLYRKSGYLTINPQLKIVDWNGDGMPIISSLLLAYYCLPSNTAGLEKQNAAAEQFKQGFAEILTTSTGMVKDFGNALTEKLGQFIKPTVESVKKAGEEAGETDSTGGNFLEGGSKVITGLAAGGVQTFKTASAALDAAAKNAMDGAEDMFQLKASPVPVNVEIGTYFYKEDMVIDGVEFEFSKEMTKNGPLFVDINIQLSSRYILKDIDSVGFKLPNDTSRVFLNTTGIK